MRGVLTVLLLLNVCVAMAFKIKARRDKPSLTKEMLDEPDLRQGERERIR